MRKTLLADALHIDKLLLDLQVEVRSLVNTKPMWIIVLTR